MIEANYKIMTDGNYCNEDAIEKTIRYIYRLREIDERPLPCYCYGVFPPTYENIIKQFHYVRTLSNSVPEQYVVHFMVSFSEKEYNIDFCRFANDIAALFSNQCLICYSMHTDTDHLHFHFIVSTVSYMPNTSPLDKAQMQQYENFMSALAQKYNINLTRRF